MTTLRSALDPPTLTCIHWDGWEHPRLTWILYCFHVFVFGLMIVVAAKSVVISEPLSEKSNHSLSRSLRVAKLFAQILVPSFALICYFLSMRSWVSRLVFEVNVDHSIYSGKARIIISKNKFSSFLYIFENNTPGFPSSTSASHPTPSRRPSCLLLSQTLDPYGLSSTLEKSRSSGPQINTPSAKTTSNKGAKCYQARTSATCVGV